MALLSHLKIIALVLLIIIALSTFQNVNNQVVGVYRKEYLIDNIKIIKKLTIQRDSQFSELIKVKNKEGKSNYYKAGNWSLKGNTLIFYTRKDDFVDCGNNANYYETVCPNDTFLFKNNEIWSVKSHHDVIHYTKEYLRW